MKKLQTLLGLALCGVLLNAGLTASAQPAKPGYATVVRVKGTASYSLDGGAHKYPLIAGKYLDPGATIFTGGDGVVDVVLGKAVDMPQAEWVPGRISLSADAPVRGMTGFKARAEQNVVRLMENSTLVIDKLTTTSSYADTVSDTELDLKKGSIYASVKKMSAASQYVVKTPKGIAGVRGTEFSLSLNEDGSIKGVAVYNMKDANGGVVLVPDPTIPAIVIIAGQAYVQGDPTPHPIPPDVMNQLQAMFSSVRTVYIEVVNYNFDNTQVLTSTINGQ